MPRSRDDIVRAPDWRMSLALAIWSGEAMISVVFLARSFSGALTQPVSAMSACLITTLFAMLALIADSLFQSATKNNVGVTGQLVAAFVTLLPPIALAVALLPPSSPASVTYMTGLFLFASVWILLTSDVSGRMTFGKLQESIIGQPEARIASPSSSSSVVTTQQDMTLPNGDMEAIHRTDATVGADGPADDWRGLPPSPTPEQPRGSNVSQWMTRSDSPLGEERIDGVVAVHLQAGEKQSMIHLPFVPPFATQPNVTCEVLGDVAARLRVAAIQTYGARIEVKRSQGVDEPVSFEVGFAAYSVPAHASAA